MSALKNRTIYAFVLKGIAVLALYAMHALMGNYLGVYAYGVVSYGLAISSILVVLVPFGWPATITRYIAIYKKAQDWHLISALLRKARLNTLLSSLVASLALTAIIFFFQVDTSVKWGLLFCALLIPITGKIAINKSVFLGLGCVRESIFIEQLVVPVTMVCAIVLLSIKSAATFFQVYIGAALVALLLSWLWLSACFAIGHQNNVKKIKTNQWTKIASTIAVGTIAQICLTRVDLLVLEYHYGMDPVGLYSAAIRIAMLNTFLLSAVDSAIAPLLSESFHSGNLESFRAIRNKGMQICAAGSLPLFFIMVLFARNLMTMFGEEFAAGAHLLVILSIGQLVNALTGPVGFSLLMSNNQRKYAFTITTILVVNIGVNLIVVPIFGVVGAAVTRASCLGLLNIWQFLLSQRLFVRNLKKVCIT